jgi:hypothetical protein
MKAQKTIKQQREEKGQRYSTTDLFNDLRNKHGDKGGGFFDWLKREREEKEKEQKK